MIPRIVTAPDRDGRSARPLSQTGVEMTRNKGEDNSKNWVQIAHKERHRSNGNRDHGRSDRDPSVLASTQAVIAGRASTARGARPAHVLTPVDTPWPELIAAWEAGAS